MKEYKEHNLLNIDRIVDFDMTFVIIIQMVSSIQY